MTVIGEMQLSIHKRYLRTNTQNTIVVNSTQYESHIRRRYSNLEIYLLPLTDTVQLPVNGPCKSRYLAKNVICSDDKNDSIISVISVISVWQVGSVWMQPREYSNTMI